VNALVVENPSVLAAPSSSRSPWMHDAKGAADAPYFTSSRTDPTPTVTSRSIEVSDSPQASLT